MEKLEKIKSIILSKENRVKLIAFLGAAAALLILISEFSSTSSSKKKDGISATTEFNQETYVTRLEEKVGQIVSSIKGAGKVKVLITLQNGLEYIYATDSKSNTNLSESTGNDGKHNSDEKSDSEEKIIVIDSGEGKNALVKKILTPTIEGVVIVCQGAENNKVKERIIEAVTTALGIPSRRVCVTILSE